MAKHWLKATGSFVYTPSNGDKGALAAPIAAGLDFDIMFWIQFGQMPVDYLQFNILNSPSRYISIRYDQPDDDIIHLKGVMRDGATLIECSYDVVPANDTPHLLRLKCDRDSPTGLKLYFDNVLVDTKNPTPLVASNFSSTYSSGGYNGIYFNHGYVPEGHLLTYEFYIDQLRVYVGDTLTNEQAAAIWNDGKGVAAADADFETFAKGSYAEFNREAEPYPHIIRCWKGTTWENGVWVTIPANVDVTTVAGGVPFIETLTVSAGSNGSITPTGSLEVVTGDDQLFAATPDSGYEVDEWLVDGVSVQTGGTTYTIVNVTADHTIEVTFVAIPSTQIFENNEELGQPELVSSETLNLGTEITNMLTEETSQLPESESGIFGNNIVAVMTGGALWSR